MSDPVVSNEIQHSPRRTKETLLNNGKDNKSVPVPFDLVSPTDSLYFGVETDPSTFKKDIVLREQSDRIPEGNRNLWAVISPDKDVPGNLKIQRGDIDRSISPKDLQDGPLLIRLEEGKIATGLEITSSNGKGFLAERVNLVEDVDPSPLPTIPSLPNVPIPEHPLPPDKYAPPVRLVNKEDGVLIHETQDWKKKHAERWGHAPVSPVVEPDSLTPSPATTPKEDSTPPVLSSESTPKSHSEEPTLPVTPLETQTAVAIAEKPELPTTDPLTHTAPLEVKPPSTNGSNGHDTVALERTKEVRAEIAEETAKVTSGEPKSFTEKQADLANEWKNAGGKVSSYENPVVPTPLPDTHTPSKIEPQPNAPKKKWWKAAILPLVALLNRDTTPPPVVLTPPTPIEIPGQMPKYEPLIPPTDPVIPQNEINVDMSKGPISREPGKSLENATRPDPNLPSQKIPDSKNP